MNLLRLMCFLTGVYVVCCSKNDVETKVKDDPTYAHGKSRAPFRLEGAQNISQLSKKLLTLCWPG